ncbi:Enriched in surface-labeled proteome protein 10 [Trypanosoma equiperdum]|uniref:EGF-like domain-containing protein n=2 Tax=Trypanozoon TaxID=39700 RepID=Q585S0_TRYB2|nr:hypothetical protein, conserved [Trypanosoma brucei brucei TREU927]AAQ15628.1 hypothetical protein, conserved [Trypanosoma brucei brucei TREU927]AAX79540.1 hypothetical protein, conserved [Trypanosoma brucei]SCU71407.1 Enriched in surface-labeled proteome protein 10 [Trypanosoma equiperdum]
MLVGVLVLYILCAPLAAVGSIAKYSKTVVTKRRLRGDDDTWTRYKPTPPGAQRLFDSLDENTPLPKLPIKTPFFSYDSVEWYVSPYGFLTLTAVPMCNSFCREGLDSPLTGSYRFARRNISEGGDWPLIGLFVADLDVTNLAGDAGVYYYTLDGEENPTKVIVEYRDIPVLNCHADGNELLTAQVEISTDGVIVARYEKVPRCRGSVGIVLSKSQRDIVQFRQREMGLVAVQYTPVPDTCGERNEGSCSETCTWCAATSSCMSAPLAGEICPRVSSNSSLNHNHYYTVTAKTESGSTQGGQSGGEPLDTTGSSVKVPLRFEFPFFTKGVGKHKINSVYILSSGVVSLLSNKQDCGPLKNVCSNGNYSYAIMPFVTSQTWGNSNAVVLRRESESITIFITTRSFGELYHTYTYWLRLEKSGAITFHYLASTVAGSREALSGFFAFPPPMIGVARYGMGDNASMIVPSAVARPGTTVRFEPRNEHDDCGINGRYENGGCVCSEGFQGNFCDDCTSGHYGPRCTKCPNCQNGGVCDSGRGGSGRCKCASSFGGKNCEKNCGNKGCVNCNSVGGYCDCGVCRCHEDSGWSGPDCTTFEDPCLKFSLQGCDACMSQEEHGCAFCADGACYSTKLEGTSLSHACSYKAETRDAPICQKVLQIAQSGTDFGYIIFFVLCLSAISLAVIISLLSRYLMYARRVVNVHVAAAAGGAPDYVPVRREREVVQAGFVPVNLPKGKKYVLGVPLKQISLHKLYKEQQNEGFPNKE